jgi:hypothetical protein
VGSLQRVSTLIVFVFWLAVANAAAQATEPQQPAVPPEEASNLRPGEVQGLFDAYVLVQVQDSLALSEEDYTRLLPRLRLLQQVRRRTLQERLRLINELRKLTDPKLPQPTDDAILKERLSAFQEFESRTAAELRRAYDGVDEVLTPRQRARFRVFEENVERRKLQLLLRATRQNRRQPSQ